MTTRPCPHCGGSQKPCHCPNPIRDGEPIPMWACRKCGLEDRA